MRGIAPTKDLGNLRRRELGPQLAQQQHGDLTGEHEPTADAPARELADRHLRGLRHGGHDIDDARALGRKPEPQLAQADDRSLGNPAPDLSAHPLGDLGFDQPLGGGVVDDGRHPPFDVAGIDFLPTLRLLDEAKFFVPQDWH